MKLENLKNEQVASVLDNKNSSELLEGLTHRLMIGRSQAIDDLYHVIQKLGPVMVPVLVTGETGVGKELAAKELHRLSLRRQKPFIAINAAALPEGLIESELFGHKKGAFTGAISDRIGLIEQSHGGTLFIDEIGELPLFLQAKLLRVLQEKIVQRVGEEKERYVDFRLITATHCNLKEMVDKKLFREDLYYRIAGAEIFLPALRDRDEDSVLLAKYFKRKMATLHQLPEKNFTPEALNYIQNNSWSGNIRELQNTVERAVIMAENSLIGIKDLNPNQNSNDRSIRCGASSSTLGELSLAEAKDIWLKNYLEKSLEINGWNKKKTAKSLEIGLRTLFRHIEQLKIVDRREIEIT